MFITFLNKTNPENLDLSVFLSYAPEKVLFYFFSSSLNIPLDYYTALKEQSASGTAAVPSQAWLDLINQDLSAEEDLIFFKGNDFLESIGPYYCPASNTRFFFYKSAPAQAEFLTSSDLDVLESFQKIELPDQAAQTYGRNKKGAKRYSRNKEEVLRDVKMCLLALNQIEALHKQMNFWHKILENRQTLLAQVGFTPLEPGNAPPKPDKPVYAGRLRSRWFLFSRKSKSQQYENYQYQRQLKVYYIRYREYEKACDRFKAILESWPESSSSFLSSCQQDYDAAAENIFLAKQNLDLYELILKRSMIHPEYQDKRTLDVFCCYLETGRASDLQECMNLFEEENLWNDIKEGQIRIENTIYLLQNDSEPLRWAQDQIDDLLNSANKPGGQLVQA